MQAKSKVVIVEDHPLFRERLMVLINKELDMSVCGEADNIRQAMEIIKATQPHAAVVDITLKGSSGLELIKDLKAQSIDIPVLVLSMHDESLYAERVIRAGAKGYITKDEASEKVMSAIRKVVAGEIYLSDSMTSRVLKNLSGKNAQHSSPLERLTDRELEVFQLIGKGKTAKEIAETLNLGLTTIDTYRARIKEKLNLRNATELVHEAAEWVRSQR
ncbi:MAG TPA: response regulator transcription factor [Chthoniobacteraceae bacterium]|nr:response regulator transcription factor [Chthoniobacteraceae bacterium]